MTNDDLDSDMENHEELEAEPAGRPSLKEAWESNPVLKVIAVVLALAIAIGVYMAFFSKEDESIKSLVHIAGSSKTKQVPGKDDLDPEYRRQLEEANKKAAEAATKTGGSALPTPISTSKSGGLELPEMPEGPKSDPLAEWRKAVEARRSSIEKEMPAEENPVAPPPEAAPLAQPVRPTAAFKQDPKAAQRLSEQMRTILKAQAPEKSHLTVLTREDSPYAVQKKANEEAKQKMAKSGASASPSGGSDTVSGSGGTGGSGSGPVQTIVPAGSIAYAQLLTELNSDIKGPVLAQILSGPFAGGRAIGKVEVKEEYNEYMVITFTHVVKDAVSYSVNGIAMDENTTLTGQATDVDHHYFVRVILPAAAKFVEGYGSAVSTTGTTTTQTAGGGQATETPKPSPKESLYKGVEESSKTIGAMLKKGAERPITVKIAKGTTMGILFMDTVTTKDAEK